MKFSSHILNSLFAVLFSIYSIHSQGIKLSDAPSGPPNGAAGLEMEFSDKGFLISRISAGARDSMQAPPLGLQIFNLTSRCLEIWMGNRWKSIVCDCDTYPDAEFTLNTASPSIGNPVTFTPVQAGLTYQWSFSGGTPAQSSQQAPSVTWSSAGQYQVSLLVSDALGCSSQKDSLITVSSCVTGGSATFTNCGQTGRFGPSQAQCNSAYGSGVVMVNAGIQTWTVPAGVCSIRVEARGAGRAYGGATMAGDFTVTPGMTIRMLIGQEGNGDIAGDGGTFVVDGSNSILVIAGGGGACAGCDIPLGELQGRTQTSGGTRSGTVAADNGQGGNTNNSASGAGGGFLTNGAGLSGGQSFLNGGVGGGGDANYIGGFGGGGSRDGGFGGGAGGGYSGGSHNWNGATSGRGGGGGGSLNNGANQTNQAGANIGQGRVTITW